MATTNEKVKFESLVNATVKANNSADTDRTYNILANVTVQGNAVETVSDGLVNTISDGLNVASFSKYSGNGLNINFTGGVDESDQCGILSAINSFIADVKAKIAANPVSPANI